MSSPSSSLSIKEGSLVKLFATRGNKLGLHNLWEDPRVAHHGKCSGYIRTKDVAVVLKLDAPTWNVPVTFSPTYARVITCKGEMGWILLTRLERIAPWSERELPEREINSLQSGGAGE